MDNNDNERVKELEAQLAAVTAERDQLADQLAAKDNGFDFGRAMARIRAREADNEAYKRELVRRFAGGNDNISTTEFI